MRRTAFALMLAAAAVSAACAEEIELISGERIEGRIAQRSAELIVLEHAILGQLEIPRQAIRSIDGRPLSPAEEQAPRLEGQKKPVAEETGEKAAPPPGPPPPPVKAQWDAQLELGVSARAGTTEESNFRSALRATRKAAGHEFRYDATYRLATSRGDRTENRFSTGFFSEWERPRPGWTAFAQGRFDMAEFQAWDQRLTAAGGLGYHLIQVKSIDDEGNPVDVFTLTGRAGIGLRQEFGSPNEDLSPEGLLGAEFAYRVNRHQSITGDTTLYPDLNDTKEFRLVSQLNWMINIDQMDGIALKLGLSHEYESRTAPGVAHYDLAAFAALVIDF